MREEKKKGYCCFNHVLVIAYGGATLVEYASISSQWRMGTVIIWTPKKSIPINHGSTINTSKKNLRLKNLEGNAKFPQFLFSK